MHGAEQAGSAGSHDEHVIVGRHRESGAVGNIPPSDEATNAWRVCGLAGGAWPGLIWDGAPAFEAGPAMRKIIDWIRSRYEGDPFMWCLVLLIIVEFVPAWIWFTVFRP